MSNNTTQATSRDVFLLDGSFVDEGVVWATMRTVVRYSMENVNVLPEFKWLASTSCVGRLAMKSHLKYVTLEAKGVIGTYNGYGFTFCDAVNKLLINSWDGKKFTNPISLENQKQNASDLHEAIEGFLRGEYM